MQEVVSGGMMFFLMGVAGSLSFMLDNVLALHLLGAEASARMAIALRLCFTASAMLGVLAQPLWPAFADASHKSDRTWIVKSFVRGVTLLTTAAVAGSMVLLIWGERLLQLWLHSTLGISQTLLWAVCVWILAQALIRVPHLLLNAVNLVLFQTLVFTSATAIALLMKFALAPSFGVAGILYATSFTVIAIALPACVWRSWRWVHNLQEQNSSLIVSDV